MHSTASYTPTPSQHFCQVPYTDLKERHHRLCILNKMAKLFKVVISNPFDFQSSPSSAIAVPFCPRITLLVFFFLCKPLFLGFATLNRNLGRQRNDSKYREVAPLKSASFHLCLCSSLQFTGLFIILMN